MIAGENSESCRVGDQGARTDLALSIECEDATKNIRVAGVGVIVRQSERACSGFFEFRRSGYRSAGESVITRLFCTNSESGDTPAASIVTFPTLPLPKVI